MTINTRSPQIFREADPFFKERNIVEETLGRTSLFNNNNISLIVRQYLTIEEQEVVEKYQLIFDILPQKVNLHNPEELSIYLSPSFKNKTSLQTALATAKRLKKTRVTGSFGYVFPLNHELLACAMQSSKGKTVLEIAGASGENAILLGFAGAKNVYLNDINLDEISTFEELRQSLPAEIQKKLHALPGSCLKILQLNPSLAGKIDLILCNNLIHFFDDKEQSAFFSLIKELLTPKGSAIFSANSIYGCPEAKALFFKYHNCTTFTAHYGELIHPNGTIERLSKVLTPARSNVQLARSSYSTLYTKASSTSEWQRPQSAAPLSPSQQKTAAKALGHKRAVCEKGIIRLRSDSFRIYNRRLLTSLFFSYGFRVKTEAFIIDSQGHLLPGGVDPFQGRSVGIIVGK